MGGPAELVRDCRPRGTGRPPRTQRPKRALPNGDEKTLGAHHPNWGGLFGFPHSAPYAKTQITMLESGFRTPIPKEMK